MPPVASSPPGARPPHHAPGGGFRNPWPGSELGRRPGLLRWIVERATQPRPPDPPPGTLERAAPSFAPRGARGELTATWVGHSTALLQLGALNVLTDPVWSDRASPVSFAGPARRMPPGIDFDALPPLDVVLLSHNHYDHLDAPTVRRLAAAHPDATWHAPLGVPALLRALGVRHVVEHDWWQEDARSHEGTGLVRVTCTPAQHFSARGLGDRNATLWCGWTLRSAEGALFFAGDTGYHPEFPEIARRLGPFDLAAIPVGAYAPRWFMRPVHMNVEEALQAWAEVTAPFPAHPCAMLPIHWGTFRLTDEPMDEPPRLTREGWAAARRPAELLWLLRHGETRRRDR